MTKLPEALRVAEYLTERNRLDLTCDEAAALLRTQHALLEQARDALDELRYATTDKAISMTDAAIAALNQHLDQP